VSLVMGYKVKAEFHGWLDEIDEEERNFYFRVTDLVSKEDYTLIIEKDNLEPPSERQYAVRGAYVRIQVRRKVLCKFYKKRFSKGALQRARKKANKKYGDMFKRIRKENGI
jgi:hypothetical protein